MLLFLSYFCYLKDCLGKVSTRETVCSRRCVGDDKDGDDDDDKEMKDGFLYLDDGDDVEDHDVYDRLGFDDSFVDVVAVDAADGS